MQLLMDFAEQLSSSVLKWIEVLRQQDIVVDPILLLLLAGVITLWLGCACWSSSIAEARGYGAKLHFFIGLLLPAVYPPIMLMGLDVKKSGTSKEKPAEKPEEKPAAQAQAPSPIPEPVPTAKHEQAEYPQPPEKKRDNSADDDIPDAPDLILPEDTPETAQTAKPSPPAAPAKPALHPLRKNSVPDGPAPSGAHADNQPRKFNQSAFRKMAEQTENSGARFRIRYAGGHEVTALDIVEATAQYAVVSVESDEGSSQRVRIPYARVEAVEPAE